MSSNKLGTCCYQGVKHEGTTVGELVQGDSFEYYVSKAKESNDKGLLILPDVTGHSSNNIKLVADQFAANGYLAFIPDLFNGDPIELNAIGSIDLMGWLNGKYNPKGHGHLPADVDPIVEKSLSIMKEKYGVKKFGAIGYCFGAKYVVRSLGTGQVSVGFSAHPSLVQDDELIAIKGPYAIAAAETDSIFPAEARHKQEEMLKKIGQPYQITLYSGVAHGFAVRGDLSKRETLFAKEAAFLQAVQWFDEYLK